MCFSAIPGEDKSIRAAHFAPMLPKQPPRLAFCAVTATVASAQRGLRSRRGNTIHGWKAGTR